MRPVSSNTRFDLCQTRTDNECDVSHEQSSSAPDRTVLPRIAAAVVVYRPDPNLLRQLLDALQAGGLPVYVHLNGPQAAETEHCLSRPGLVLSRSPKNGGQARGLNLLLGAADAAGFSHVFLLDQDSTPQPDLVARLAERFATLTEAGYRLAAVGPRLVVPPGSNYLPIVVQRLRSRPGQPPASVAFLPTSGSLISIAAWREAGPFREDYFIGGVDVEWGFRAWSRGFASVIVDEARMVHRWGEADVIDGRPQILRQPPSRVYYYVRNAAHGLSMPHMSLRWKLWQIGRFLAQLPLVLLRRDDISAAGLSRALRDGWAGRLGPLPRELSRD